MNVVGHTESGGIRVVFDGDVHETYVPDDMGNLYRVRIWDEWEMGPPDPETGIRERVNTIPPYVAPQIYPLTHPLPRLIFWLVAAQASVSKWSVRDRIAAMPEGLEKYEAIAWFEEAKQYRRHDPILVEHAAAEGIPPPQLDALWIWALQTYNLLPSTS